MTIKGLFLFLWHCSYWSYTISITRKFTYFPVLYACLIKGKSESLLYFVQQLKASQEILMYFVQQSYQNQVRKFTYFLLHFVAAMSTYICLRNVKQLGPLSLDISTARKLPTQSSNSFPATLLQTQKFGWHRTDFFSLVINTLLVRIKRLQQFLCTPLPSFQNWLVTTITKFFCNLKVGGAQLYIHRAFFSSLPTYGWSWLQVVVFL